MSALATQFLAPPLVQRELRLVQSTKAEYEHFTVKVRPAAAEVVGLYERDAMKMELVIGLPPSYPLEMVSVRAQCLAFGVWRLAGPRD